MKKPFLCDLLLLNLCLFKKEEVNLSLEKKGSKSNCSFQIYE
jgi:hypothetical protein